MTSELDLGLIYFNPKDILVSLFFFVLILVLTNFKANGIQDKEEAKLYRLNVYFKLLLSTVFAAFFTTMVYKGGDTFSYWRTAEVLKNLFYYDIEKFWTVITTPPSWETMSGFFNYKTGYPPSYIYREEESFFVAKITFFFYLVTQGNYLASTHLFAFFMANASWKVYLIAKKSGIFNDRLMIIFTLFLPSVAFWASGVSKDTIVLIAILNIIYILNRLFKERIELKLIILLLIFSYATYKIRPFILAASILPISLMIFSSMINKIKDFTLLKNIVRFIAFISVGVITIVALRTIDVNSVIMSNQNVAQAVVIQQDFENNISTYGGEAGKRYSLGGDPSTLPGLIALIPSSIVAGIYRPFIWEALTPSLIFNGLESLLLMMLTAKFFISSPRKRLQVISNTDILVFSVGFIFVIAFMTGFTSILFGVLVRLRAPLLPFFGLLLSIDMRKVELKKEQE
jgi:hypothetical protein